MSLFQTILAVNKKPNGLENLFQKIDGFERTPRTPSDDTTAEWFMNIHTVNTRTIKSAGFTYHCTVDSGLCSHELSKLQNLHFLYFKVMSKLQLNNPKTEIGYLLVNLGKTIGAAYGNEMYQ